MQQPYDKMDFSYNWGEKTPQKDNKWLQFYTTHKNTDFMHYYSSVQEKSSKNVYQP